MATWPRLLVQKHSWQFGQSAPSRQPPLRFTWRDLAEMIYSKIYLFISIFIVILIYIHIYTYLYLYAYIYMYLYL